MISNYLDKQTQLQTSFFLQPRENSSNILIKANHRNDYIMEIQERSYNKNKFSFIIFKAS